MKESLRYKVLTNYARDSVLKLSHFYNSEEQGSEAIPFVSRTSLCFTREGRIWILPRGLSTETFDFAQDRRFDITQHRRFRLTHSRLSELLVMEVS